MDRAPSRSDAPNFDAPDFDAVVLAGGGGRRLGGLDKAGLDIGGVPLLDRVLAACAGAGHTVVVGPERPTAVPVSWTCESPPGGGPLAGLVAGMARLAELAPGPDRPVVVLATDLPRLRNDDVVRLLVALAAGDGSDAAMFTDGGGRLQPLAAAYRRNPLTAALADEDSGSGRPMRILAERLEVVTVADHGAAEDCDTPEQLALHRQTHRTELDHG